MSSDVAADLRSQVDRDEDAVALRDVVFCYPKREPVLVLPELHLRKDESVFLHGPSGSGKSTLLSIVAGALLPRSGQVEVLGHAFHAISAAARDRVRGGSMGYVFQNFNLIPYLSVRQNIALPCELYRERLRHLQEGTLTAEVERLARRLDILAHLDDRPGSLSVGQQQRVAIARALIGAPVLLIADEPTSALDANRRDRFLALLLEMLEETRAQGRHTTLLYVSHDMALAPHFTRTLSLPDLNHAAAPRQELHATA